jgi:uroporphyrinogen-III synthase
MRVLITRPGKQAEAFAQKLSSIGAEPFLLPAIEINPLADTTILDRALSRLNSYDWMVLTSTNGVEAVFERMAAIGVVQPASLRLAAVGPKTAGRLEEHGFAVDFMPGRYTGEAIVPGLGDLRGRWVLLPTADIATNALPRAIEAAGGVAHVITAYHTLPADPDPVGLAALQDGVDVLTFTSGSSARNFVLLVRNAGLDPFDLPGKPKVACIGPKTAGVAADLGFLVEIIAENYTIDGLVAAINESITRTPS